MRRSIQAGLLAAMLVVGLLPASSASADVRRSNFRRVGGVQASTGGHIVFEGNRLYMGTYGRGFRIFDISAPTQPRHIGTYEPGVRADAVPDAALWDGRHIAVLGGTGRIPGAVPVVTTSRTEILDVTNPASPQLLHAYVGPPDGESHNVDFYDARRLMFSSGSGGDNGLRIYDVQPVLSNAPDPTGTNTANDPIRLWPSDACRTDANIFCDPTTMWENSPYRQGRPVGSAFTHTHDITIYPNYLVRQPNGQFAPRDIVLLAEGGVYQNNAGNTGSTFVIDVTDPANPVVLYRWLHEQGPGHHPIRYHHEAMFLEGDPHVMLTSDEDLHNGCGGAGGVVAVRLNDSLTDGVELSEWYTPAGTPAPNCSAHVMSNVNNIMFMGAYNAGVQAVDWSNPRKPAQVGEWIGEGSNTWGAAYNPDNGYVYAGDFGGRGLDVLQYLGPGAEKPGKGGLRTCPGARKKQGTHIVGTGAADVLRGTKGRDVICGVGGKDRIAGLGGDDIVLGGGGADKLSGGKGRDVVRGGGKDDRISGGASRDRCWGGPATDTTRSCEAGRA